MELLGQFLHHLFSLLLPELKMITFLKVQQCELLISELLEVNHQIQPINQLQFATFKLRHFDCLRLQVILFKEQQLVLTVVMVIQDLD